jgi:hypothetical protein
MMITLLSTYILRHLCLLLLFKSLLFLIQFPEFLTRIAQIDEALEVLHPGVHAVLKCWVEVPGEALLCRLENTS